jgi:hypothetical protein
MRPEVIGRHRDMFFTTEDVKAGVPVSRVGVQITIENTGDDALGSVRPVFIGLTAPT